MRIVPANAKPAAIYVGLWAIREVYDERITIIANNGEAVATTEIVFELSGAADLSKLE